MGQSQRFAQRFDETKLAAHWILGLNLAITIRSLLKNVNPTLDFQTQGIGEIGLEIMLYLSLTYPISFHELLEGQTTLSSEFIPSYLLLIRLSGEYPFANVSLSLVKTIFSIFGIRITKGDGSFCSPRVKLTPQQLQVVHKSYSWLHSRIQKSSKSSTASPCIFSVR